MIELRSTVVSGLKWSGSAQVAQQLAQFIMYITLARLLSPREFGLMGMIIILTGFAGLFIELGLGSALIQKQDLEERHLNSIFWVNAGAGMVLSIVFVIFAPTIAAFYNEPILQDITRVLSLNFFLNSLNVVQRNILIKALSFRRIFFVDTVSIVLSGLTAIAMAVSGLGVWSLVTQPLIHTGSSTLMMWKLSPWRPTFKFDKGALRELSGFSLNLLGFSVFDYLMTNVDKVLVGRFIGSASLGIYTRAYQIMLLPVTQVSSVITRVMFPALSSIQNDKEKVKRIYLLSTRMIAFITFPMMIGLLVVARPFILLIFGPQWYDVILILQIFCLTGMGHSIGTTLGWIYTSQGRTDIMFKWGVFAGIIRIAAMVIGLRWGIIGLAVAYVLSSFVFLTYPGWRIAGSLINMGFGEMMANLAGPFLCAVAMGITVGIMGFSLPDSWPLWIHLALQVSLGIVIYSALVHCLRIKVYKEIRMFILQELRGGH